jgi:hypothetical protein
MTLTRRPAQSLWHESPNRPALRPADLPPLGPGEALVRTLFSGISRGTERLVLQGRVPASEHDRMRAPMQEGAFPFPVKYGYCAVGVVEEGPAELLGRTVFCLHPHQDRFVAPTAMLAPVPEGVPARRATLAANMETALNALWDAGAGPADRIAVIGGGVLGLLVAHLAAKLPGAEVTLHDTDPARAAIAARLGIGFGRTQNCDAVFHASASAAGLAAAIEAAGTEATITELSWYGDREINVPLGGAFHSQRLRITASQVGRISPSRRPRWTHARRLQAALGLLQDPRLDALVEHCIDFADAPALLPAILADGALGLAPVIRYPGAV